MRQRTEDLTSAAEAANESGGGELIPLYKWAPQITPKNGFGTPRAIIVRHLQFISGDCRVLTPVESSIDRGADIDAHRGGGTTESSVAGNTHWGGLTR